MNSSDEDRYRRWTVLYILCFCAVWWAAFSLSRHYLDSADMVENYAWGREWQWGTNKHPPLFGWITAAWFRLFPTTDWAYYLLNELNLGIALWLMALAMGRMLPADKVLAAIVLTSLCSHFGPDSGYKYNANTAQLPFIAGFLWSMLHALESRRPSWFIAAGVFGAAALLTKYYALVLFVAIGLSVLISLRPPLAEFLKGSALSAATAVLLISPHVIWSIRHGWPGLHYMRAAHEAADQATGFMAYAITIIGVVQFSGIALLTFAGSLFRLPATASAGKRTPRLGLVILASSVVLTLLAAWAQNISPVSSWLIPPLLFLGWALLDLTPRRFQASGYVRRIAYAGVLYLAIALIIALLWEGRYRTYPAPPSYALSKTLAADVTRYYRTTYGQPIQFVAGTFPLPYDLAFYSSDHPHALYGLDLAQSPWIDRGALQAGNKVVVCRSEHVDTAGAQACSTQAQDLFGKPDQVTHLEYRVYDPKAQRLGHQEFEILSWKPGKNL
ncbi:MAG TPA: glycosyltransferase family 39 protein [Thiobacillaceae bacterium]|nr:glycosyltransferase family 39 protein [Thiobacillaceae bacterium]